MQELAHFHRKCFDIPIIAIGGSNGKTTTKNLIINVLKQNNARIGAAVICNGGGGASAMVIERN